MFEDLDLQKIGIVLLCSIGATLVVSFIMADLITHSGLLLPMAFNIIMFIASFMMLYLLYSLFGG